MANEAINASAGRQTATSTMTAPRSPCCRCVYRSEEHTSELQSQSNLVCRLLLEKKKKYHNKPRLNQNNTFYSHPQPDRRVSRSASRHYAVHGLAQHDPDLPLSRTRPSLHDTPSS